MYLSSFNENQDVFSTMIEKDENNDEISSE